MFANFAKLLLDFADFMVNLAIVFGQILPEFPQNWA